MEISVDREIQLQDIQKQFGEAYPFLKLEILGSDVKKAFVAKPLSYDSRKKQYRVNATDKVSLDGARTVAELEQDFKNLFDLSIQVYRKAGNMWIETTLTHDWTLEQQNREGELFSSFNK